MWIHVSFIFICSLDQNRHFKTKVKLLLWLFNRCLKYFSELNLDWIAPLTSSIKFSSFYDLKLNELQNACFLDKSWIYSCWHWRSIQIYLIFFVTCDDFFEPSVPHFTQNDEGVAPLWSSLSQDQQEDILWSNSQWLDQKRCRVIG